LVKVQLAVSFAVVQAPDQIAVRSVRLKVTVVPVGNVADPVVPTLRGWLPEPAAPDSATLAGTEQEGGRRQNAVYPTFLFVPSPQT
jgi:hypothetical protein